MQRFEHTAHSHTANLFDLGASNRLAVGDDGHRFERCRRQPLRTHRYLRALNCFGVFGARQDLPPTALLQQLDAMSIDIIVLAQFVERRCYRCKTRLGVQCRQCVERNGARGGEQRGFKQLR